MTRATTSLGVLLVAASALAGCGGGTTFANLPRPAVPVNVSVYVNDQSVSVSPSTVSPGTVTFTITNQSSNAQALDVTPSGGTTATTSTGPISPQGTDQVTVSLRRGQYSVGIAPANAAQAATASPAGITSGLLTVEGRRPNSNNQVLQP